MSNITHKRGILALSPLGVFMGFYLIASVVVGDFYKVPITVAFMLAGIYAIVTSVHMPLSKRIETYSKGAGATNLMLMFWIYVLAGAFAQSAKEMGSIDATVNLTLSILPANMLLPGLFLAACFISLAIGTSVGTVVALVPIAGGIAQSIGASLPMMVAIIVGGAYFGDNLSFISDTTVVATQTQGCPMKDKFIVNSFIVVPAALVILVIYFFMGAGLQPPPHLNHVNIVKVIPYIVVIVVALVGMNVMAVLTLGVLLCGTIGILLGSFDFFGWLNAVGKGVSSMGELILIAMMAGGMLEIIKENGGIKYLINRLTAHVHSKRAAELTIAALVSVVNICTANNTVAILTVGGISKQIGDQYGIDNRKAASILDTFACFVQGILPYGVQMLLAAALVKLNPMQILPHLYYPMAMGVAALLSILFRYPKRYS